MKTLKRLGVTAAALVVLFSATVQAKLPAPSDEAKAKAAEAAAKTAWTNQVANYQLCKSMDQVAASYVVQAKKSGKEVKPAVATPPCADPGAFVYVPASAASGATAAAAPAAVTAAAPAVATAAKAPPKK